MLNLTTPHFLLTETRRGLQRQVYQRYLHSWSSQERNADHHNCNSVCDIHWSVCVVCECVLASALHMFPGRLCVTQLKPQSLKKTSTHTHTHTYRERERESFVSSSCDDIKHKRQTCSVFFRSRSPAEYLNILTPRHIYWRIKQKITEMSKNIILFSEKRIKSNIC